MNNYRYIYRKMKIPSGKSFWSVRNTLLAMSAVAMFWADKNRCKVNSSLASLKVEVTGHY